MSPGVPGITKASQKKMKNNKTCGAVFVVAKVCLKKCFRIKAKVAERRLDAPLNFPAEYDISFHCTNPEFVQLSFFITQSFYLQHSTLAFVSIKTGNN